MQTDLSLKDLKDLPDDVAIDVGDGRVYTKKGMLEQLQAGIAEVKVDVIAQRDDWVRYRTTLGVEERWRRAKMLYEGEDVPDNGFIETLKSGPSARRDRTKEATRSRVVVNIVRPKTDQAIARMCEILLPVDDRNWGIKQTPVPEAVQKMLGDMRVTVMPNGQPNPEGLTADQEAKQFVSEARKKAAAMENTIDDQLTECDYNGEQRLAITDGVKMGAGIMLGPFPAKQTSKAWVDGGLVFNEKTVPASMHADPWDVWFDPACGNDVQAGAGFWYRKPVTRKQLRAMKGVLGFDDQAIDKVLAQQPNRVTVAEGRVRRNMASKEQAYEMWTYHGELDPDDCYMMSQNANGDPEKMRRVDFGVVILVNDEVVGVMPSWIPDKSLPVDVWNWRKADEHPYGHGLPEELEHQQRVVTAAWRQVMDNARFSVGSQIVFLDGVTPADGSSDATVSPGRMWRVDPAKIDDATKAMAAVDIPSHLGELLAIADKAMEFADAEAQIPQLMQGEQGSASETLGGMILLHTNANAVLRLRVKLYDDDLTRPHISRYYDWNMANNPDENIKGDMEVDARGSTALLERDIQNQATLNLANITSNPRYAPYLNPKMELETILKAMKINPENVMAEDEEIKRNLEAASKAPPDPRIVAAQMNVQAKQLELQDRQQQRQVDAQEEAANRADRAADRQYNMQREQAEFEIAMTHERNQQDLQQQRLAADERISTNTVQTNAQLKLLDIDTKRQIFNAEANLRRETGAGI